MANSWNAGTWRQELLKETVRKSSWLHIKLSCVGLFPSTPATSAAVKAKPASNPQFLLFYARAGVF